MDPSLPPAVLPFSVTKCLFFNGILWLGQGRGMLFHPGHIAVHLICALVWIGGRFPTVMI